MTSLLPYLFFWTHKSPESNTWRPVPGANPKPIDNLPPFLARTDLAATSIDAAPFIAGAGSLAHLRQIHKFGFTASANIFANPKTLRALHRTTLVLIPAVLVAQALGLEYRYAIPRWSHEREMRRDEEEVRRHVDVGMYAGVACWAVRLYGLRWGRAFWAPMEVVMGGALADLMHREYGKAHGF
ncbi:hypothetical protein EJ03DRAFT_332331 [Teratosphaeria nubilosa]|uniref:Uncharacterized protein n=1 Tax=Teratosphaeria nubilosa TaxID=161662 RepID=A0A6G1KV31_9PEZI|nr:hypothetical protein EJ03DRAFT_332331 [Teratosphaeria nubilosa]